jgi:hypothetical protein
MYSPLSSDMTNIINQERLERAKTDRLRRQVQAVRPSAFNSYLLSVGKLLMALGFALKLR